MLLDDEFRYEHQNNYAESELAQRLAATMQYAGGMADASPFDGATLSLDPEDCEPRQIYKLMTGIIVPRPVALVSTIDRHGIANLAPFSFFSGVGSDPPTVMFCPVLRPRVPATFGHIDSRKDTLRNVEDTGEFVVNIVSEAISEAANATAADVAPEVDEFVIAGLTPQPSQAVRPPRVAESPAQMECKLSQIVYTGRNPGAGVVVLGEVVRFHVRSYLVNDFRVDPSGLDAVGRMAGNTWARTRDRIELVRPK